MFDQEPRPGDHFCGQMLGPQYELGLLGTPRYQVVIEAVRIIKVDTAKRNLGTHTHTQYVVDIYVRIRAVGLCTSDSQGDFGLCERYT